MATDATGTPTSLGIRKYNPDADAPSGLGFNGAMDDIDALLVGRVAKTLWTTAGDILYASGVSTPVRLGIGSTGQVLTVSGGLPAWAASAATNELAVAQITAPVSVSATTEGTATTCITLPATAFDGSTKVKLEVKSPYLQSPGSNAAITVVLYDGAASVGILAHGVDGNSGAFLNAEYEFTPAAATKTYSIRAFVSSGTGTFQAGAGGVGAYVPAFARISRAA